MTDFVYILTIRSKHVQSWTKQMDRRGENKLNKNKKDNSKYTGIILRNKFLQSNQIPILIKPTPN